MPDIPVTELTAKSKENVEPDEVEDGTPGLAEPAKPGLKPFWAEELVKPALVKAGLIVTNAARILSEACDRPCARLRRASEQLDDPAAALKQDREELQRAA
jgi:hypothetical protein